jgi:putative FmdB family regulatory protein
MPLYEYRCPACDRVFEELRRAGDDDEASCPACGRPAPRIVSLSAFALKGSGFYATDYVSRRPGSFQRDGNGVVRGTEVAVPQLARDPSVPLAPANDATTPPPSDNPDDEAKEGA